MQGALKRYRTALLAKAAGGSAPSVGKGLLTVLMELGYVGAESEGAAVRAESLAAGLMEGSEGHARMFLTGEPAPPEGLLSEKEARAAALKYIGREQAAPAPAPPTREPLNLASLPVDILEEIADYFLSRNLFAPVSPAGRRDVGLLSLVCRRFRLVFQPMVFRVLTVSNERHAASLPLPRS
jgi:hypothetical protein